VRRREFIALVGGTALLLAAKFRRAHAQQPTMPVIGFLDSLGGLRIDTRWAAGDTARIRGLAAEMVTLGPDVIFTSGFSTIRPLLDATSTIPIVFANVVDPVGAGFVAPPTAARSMRPSRPLHASGPTRSSLAAAPSSPPGVFNWFN
jgi:hypothetical protein